MYCHIRSVFFVHSNRKMTWYLEMECMFSDLQKKNTHLSYFNNFKSPEAAATQPLPYWSNEFSRVHCSKKKGPVLFRGTHRCGRAKQIQRHFCRWFLGSVMFRPKATPPPIRWTCLFREVVVWNILGMIPPKKSSSGHSGLSGVWVENSFRILHDFPLQIEGIQ